jgi:glutathione reductase (NADPH)
MRSVSNPRVWAAGDVTGTGLPLTPVAGVQGSAVAENIIQGGNAEKPDMSAIPSVVFTLPPLGKVGLTEQEAEEAGLDYEVKAKDTDHWYSQRRVGQENTGFKVLLEKGTDRILGAHVLGHHAEEVVNAFALAMQHGLTAADLKSTSFVYPSAIHFMKYML